MRQRRVTKRSPRPGHAFDVGHDDFAGREQQGLELSEVPALVVLLHEVAVTLTLARHDMPDVDSRPVVANALRGPDVPHGADETAPALAIFPD
ncbi:MAG: hypothetical protein WA624_24640 [Methylocella sp.]